MLPRRIEKLTYSIPRLPNTCSHPSSSVGCVSVSSTFANLSSEAFALGTAKLERFDRILDGWIQRSLWRQVPVSKDWLAELETT